MDQRINRLEDFIFAPKYYNSLEKALEAHPNGFPTKQVAKMLDMTEKEVNEIIGKVIKDIREAVE